MLVLLLACATDLADDRAIYVSLATHQGLTADDIARCGSITDPSLAADCALLVATRVGSAQGDVAAHCDRVPAGVWRHECWFMGAEQSAAAGRRDEAVQRCEGSGPFRDDCVYHAWQGETARLAEISPTLRDMARDGQPVQQAWGRLLGPNWNAKHLPIPGDTWEQAFWRTAFRSWFELRDAPDLARCEPLARRAACRAGGIEAVRREANQQRERGVVDCAHLPETPRDWEVRGVHFAPDDQLMTALDRLCQ